MISYSAETECRAAASGPTETEYRAAARGLFPLRQNTVLLLRDCVHWEIIPCYCPGTVSLDSIPCCCPGTVSTRTEYRAAAPGMLPLRQNTMLLQRDCFHLDSIPCCCPRTVSTETAYRAAAPVENHGAAASNLKVQPPLELTKIRYKRHLRDSEWNGLVM